MPDELKKKGIYWAMEGKMKEAAEVFTEMIRVSELVGGNTAERYFMHARAVFESKLKDKKARKGAITSAQKCIQQAKRVGDRQRLGGCQQLLETHAPGGA